VLRRSSLLLSSGARNGEVTVLARWVVKRRKAAQKASRRCVTTKGRPGMGMESCFRSALQTYLQGVDGATLAMMPEERIHAQPSFPELSWVLNNTSR